jgi:hypothetical protein
MDVRSIRVKGVLRELDAKTEFRTFLSANGGTTVELEVTYTNPVNSPTEKR